MQPCRKDTEKRSSREEMAELANKYFSAIELNDGKGDYSFSVDSFRNSVLINEPVSFQDRKWQDSKDRSV